jgi:hypothetical protein
MKISRRPAARFGWSRGRRKSFLSRTCVAGRWEGKESGDLGDLEFGWGWGTESLLPELPERKASASRNGRISVGFFLILSRLGPELSG